MSVSKFCDKNDADLCPRHLINPHSLFIITHLISPGIILSAVAFPDVLLIVIIKLLLKQLNL